eukprot:5032486-Pyramimonas_sp.AAC.1
MAISLLVFLPPAADRGARSRSVRGGCPDVPRACWMLWCILGRGPLDVLFVLADRGSQVLEGCSSGPGPTVLLPPAGCP